MNPMHIQTSDNAADRLVNKLLQYGLTIDPTYLKEIPKDPEKRSRQTARDRTPFFIEIRRYLSYSVTAEWVEQLTDNAYCPDWHTISIDPKTSPIESTELLTVATSREDALAFVIEHLEIDGSIVQHINETGSGGVTLIGVKGAIATIEKLQITPVEDKDNTRASNAIKGLSIHDSPEKYRQHLSRIEGLMFPLSHEVACNGRYYDPYEPLHVSSKHLCKIMERFLSKVMLEKVPSHIAQELLASYLGFENWNLLKGKEKQRAKIIGTPYAIIESTGNYPTDRIIEAHLGLPNALYAFGQQLKNEENASYSINPSCSFFAMANQRRLQVSEHRNGRDYDVAALEVKLKDLTISERIRETPPELKAALSSTDLESAIKNYLFTDEDMAQRVSKINVRRGVQLHNHLFLDNWVCWIKEGSKTYFDIKPLDKSNHLEDFLATGVYDLSLIQDENMGIWLKTIRSEYHFLPGLSQQEALLISHRFEIDLGPATTTTVIAERSRSR